MKRMQAALLLLMIFAWATPAPAQFFSRKPKPNPSQRVPELILTLKTEQDERKRAHAAEELREYDAAVYTEIVPVLVDVLLHDKKPGVRLEALNSLVRIRPVQPLAYTAIEKAGNDDDSWRLRWQAKTSLTKMQVTGNTPKKADAPPQAQKKPTEPGPMVVDMPPGGNMFTIEVMPMPSTPAPAVPKPLPPSVVPAPKTPAPTQGPALFP